MTNFSTRLDEAKLEFAYKYPFSDEAKEIVGGLGIEKIEQRYLEDGVARVAEALKEGVIPFTPQAREQMRLRYVVSYVYSRMLISALGSEPASAYLVAKYAIAEARRCSSALWEDSRANIDRLAKSFGIDFSVQGEDYLVPFYSYLQISPKGNREYSLLHQELDNGVVYLNKGKFLRLFEEGAKRAILKGLPIDRKSLPKEIIDASRRISVPRPKMQAGMQARGFEWVEKLLEMPLADFRHRAVNLILAPYFVNVKNLPQDQAVSAIMEYINKCKALNPQTDITEVYVKYQVNYAKKRGLKPYSLARAKSLIGDALDFGTMEEKADKKKAVEKNE